MSDEPPVPGFFAHLERAMAARHFSPSTKKSYVHWLRRFVQFNSQKSPRLLGEAEVTEFLNDLVIEQAASPSTHRQALCAILFAYRQSSGSTSHGSKISRSRGSSQSFPSS